MVALVLLFSILLVQFPTAFGDSPPAVARLASLLPFAAALVVLGVRRSQLRIRPLHLVLFGAYVLLIIVAVLRAGAGQVVYSPQLGQYRAMGWLVLATLGLAAFAWEPRRSARTRYLEALCWAPVVYVTFNVALEIIGFAPGRSAGFPSGDLPATLLNTLGIPGTRTLFPLSSGINSFGAIAGVSLAITILLAWRRTGPRRWSAVLGAGVSLYALLAVDSRGSLLFSLSAVLLVLLVPRAKARGLAGLPLVLPILPLLLIGFLTTEANSSFITQFSRNGASLATGTNRFTVWDAILSFLGDFRLEHIIGYGSFGQVDSGVSLLYTTTFRGYDDPLAASSHNFLLQAILDTGYLGLLVVLPLSVIIISRLGKWTANEPSPEGVALLGAVLCLLLIGVVDAVPSESSTDTFAFWLLALTAALSAPQREQRVGASSNSNHGAGQAATRVRDAQSRRSLPPRRSQHGRTARGRR